MALLREDNGGLVDGTETRVTLPWTSSRTKAARERKAHQAMMDRAGLTRDIVYMARPVVAGSTPRLKRKNVTNPVKVYHVTARDLAPSNGGNPDA